MDRISRPAGWIALVTFLAAAGDVALSGDAQIDVKYTSVPTRPLPSDIRVISVQKPEYLHRASDDGIMRDDQARWYDVLIRLLEFKFSTAAPHVTLIDWGDRSVSTTIELSRKIDGGDPDDAPVVLLPDAVIVARFVFSTPHVERFRVKRKLHERIIGGIARRIPIFGGGVDDPRYEWRYRVRVNVTGNLLLKRAGSGETLLPYGRDLQASQMTDEGIFGYGAQQLFELDTVETLIAALIEEHTDNFLSKIVPIRRCITKRLEHVRPRLAAAVEQLNAGNLDRAIDRAFSAWGRDKNCHEACFVIGMVWELKARREEAEWNEAVAWYSRALKGDGNDADYRAALDRARSAAQHGPRVAGR